MTTFEAFLFNAQKNRRHYVSAIPVAKGYILTALTLLSPFYFSSLFSNQCVVIYKAEEPAAFGCISVRFPDLPCPCVSP